MSEHPRGDDEKLASLMKQLPQQPLPPGFMQRLERRRRAEDAAARPARKTGYLLPFPARAAAFALSSVIVSLVLYDKARVMFPAGAARVSSEATPLPSTALSVSDVELARARGTGRRLLRARGEPLDAVAVEALRRKEAEATAAAQAAPAAPQPTNEELLAGLERQKKKLGVRGYVAPPPPAVAAMAKLRAGIDAQLLKAAPPPAQLGAGNSPALLAEASADGSAGAAAGGAGGSFGAAAPKPLAVEKGAPVAPAAKVAAAGAAFADRVAPAAAPEAAPAAAAPAAAEGLLLKSPDERAKAWSERGMHAAPPSVNFNVNVIALVVAPDLQTAVEIIGVSTHSDGVVVKYRLFPRLAEVASTARSGSTLVRAYQFRVIPRTDKPVVFSRVE